MKLLASRLIRPKIPVTQIPDISIENASRERKTKRQTEKTS